MMWRMNSEFSSLSNCKLWSVSIINGTVWEWFASSHAFGSCKDAFRMTNKDSRAYRRCRTRSGGGENSKLSPVNVLWPSLIYHSGHSNNPSMRPGMPFRRNSSLWQRRHSRSKAQPISESIPERRDRAILLLGTDSVYQPVWRKAHERVQFGSNYQKIQTHVRNHL